jgi:hypothetical protein
MQVKLMLIPVLVFLIRKFHIEASQRELTVMTQDPIYYLHIAVFGIESENTS